MAIAMKGLRLKPEYEDLVGVAVSDKLYDVKFLNRDAKFLREGFVLSQLDGEGMRQMQLQQEQASKEPYKEHLLKELAKNTGANTHGLRNDPHQELRSKRAEKALHFDISQGDDDDDVGMTQTTSSGVQAEAQTSSSGVQAEAQTSSSGVQANVRPKTTSSGTQSTTRVEESETQTRKIKTKERGSQATEDRSEEIEKLRHASELEKQALIEQHVQNVERIRQQVMAEADTSHHRKKEEYKQEVLEQLQINEADAQRRIQQAQQQAQQEARQYVGSVVNYAEQAHINKLREGQSKTEQAEKRTKTTETSERNTEHKNERTPDNRSQAKQKAGGSPKELSPVPPFPNGGGENASSGSRDYPESEHEARRPQGRPSNTKPTNQGPPVKKYATNKPKPKAKANPKHDTETINNDNPGFWKQQNLGLIKSQLGKRLFKKKHKNPNGSRVNKPHYLAEVLKMINEGSWEINY